MNLLSQQRELTKTDRADARIPRTYWDARLDRVPALPHKALVSKWIADAKSMLTRGFGLILWGQYRQGKTALACICLQEAIAWGARGRFIRADEIASCVMDNSDNELAQADILVIDDIYNALGRDQQAAMVERLIRSRYDWRRTTIVTTNSLTGISEKYGESLALVLASRCKSVEVKGTKFFDEERRELGDAFGK